MILVYIILSLFVLLWVVPLILWNFVATPEQKQNQKDFEIEHRRAFEQQSMQGFKYSVPFLN